MSFVKSDGTYIYSESAGPLFSTQTGVTGAGNTAAQETACTVGRLTLTVTAVSGTSPTLTVNVQGSPDGSTWVTIASFPLVNSISATSKNFTPLDRYVRAQWGAPGGSATPTFTFAIVGDLL